MSEGTQRRLAAILAADVVGYSRLMGEDEAGTLAALRQLRSELFAPTVQSHGGTVIKDMGDGWLVAFDSAADAVTCAVAVQETLADHETIKLRVGVHVGDVTHADKDVFGDGVNIAARLQDLAEPGAIVISDTSRRSIDGKLAGSFNDLGRQKLKNITDPVTAYGWGMIAASTKPTGLEFSDKPAIAVLPFDNMSGDAEQDYFADGITEDIITVLSKFQTFNVSARNSTFAYKGTSTDIKQMARDLRANYVVEGSVRKGGERVRITAQLIDAESGNHVWAERYDRELEDIFAVQDEITERIVAAVAPGVLAAEIRRAQKKDANDLDTWDAIMRARWHLMRFSATDSAEAKRLLSWANERDPNNVVAWSDLAWCHLFDFSFGWCDSVPAALEHASQAAERAIALDRGDARAQTARGIVALFAERHEEAAKSLEMAIELNGSDPLARGYLGLTLVFGGHGAAACSHFQDAMRLSPRDHFMIIWLIGSAFVSFAQENFDEAIEWLLKARQENPKFPDVYALLAASNAFLGNTSEARLALKELLRIMPGLTARDPRLVRPFKQTVDRDRFLDGLRKAGLGS